MKNNVVRVLISFICFIAFYTGISYLLNGSIDWESAIFCSCGYIVGLILVIAYTKKKKGK